MTARGRATRGILRAVLFLFLLPPPAAAEEERALDRPLDRRVRLDLWGASLDGAARAIKEQAGVDVLFYLADLPAAFTASENVWLVTGDVTVGTVMETLARRFGFRFHVSGEGRVEVSRGYGWAGGDGALRFIRTQPLEPEGGTEAFLREFAKPLALLGGDFSLRFEPYPVPGNPDFLRGTAVLPAVLADYLERAVACFAGSGGDYPAGRDNPALFARAAEYGRNWGELLARRVAAPQGTDVKAILAGVAEQAGVAILLRTPPADSAAILPADAEWYTLGQIAGLLATEGELGRRVFLSCGGVLFERGAGEGYETDDRSRELFWNGLAVAGFDVRRAAEAVGESILAAVLRREAFPGVWRDPACSLVYNRTVGRLVVVAPMNAVEAVAGVLRNLEAEQQ